MSTATPQLEDDESANGNGHFQMDMAKPPDWWTRTDAELQHELRELMNQRQAQQVTEQEMHQHYADELLYHRRCCNEEEEQLSQLAKLIETTRIASEQQLHEASRRRSTLIAEAREERTKKAGLSTHLADEKAEAESRLQLAEQQLATAQAARKSLEVQVTTAMNARDELTSHIQAEKVGRSELAAAGRRELERIREPHDNALFNIDAESDAASQREATAQLEEEAELARRFDSARAERAELKAQLEVETAAWNYEVHVFRTRLQRCDEECRAEEEVVQSLGQERDNCNSEQQELLREVDEIEMKIKRADGRIQTLTQAMERQEKELASLTTGEGPPQSEQKKVMANIEQMREEIRQENDLRLQLEDELRLRSGPFSCFKGSRKPPPGRGASFDGPGRPPGAAGAAADVQSPKFADAGGSRRGSGGTGGGGSGVGGGGGSGVGGGGGAGAQLALPASGGHRGPGSVASGDPPARSDRGTRWDGAGLGMSSEVDDGEEPRI